VKKALVLALLMLAGRLGFCQIADPTKIPHYFGPYPNWANSPLTTVDANIQLTDTCGNGAGTGATAVASVDSKGAITGITVTNQGTGYTCPPNVAIASTYGSGAAAHATFTASSGYVSAITLVNGGTNYFAPVVTVTGNGTGATADATIDPYSGTITGIALTNPGTGYTSASISISDSGGTGTGAMATAAVSTATIAVVVDAAGIGYRTPGGLRKFVDTLPGLGPSAANNLGQYVSVAHPDTKSYPGSDYYEIAVVEYSRKLHSDLPATKLRGYVQLNYGTDASGSNTIAPDPPQFLGATIIATKDRPVRILFRNKLAIGADGNLFLPVDTTMMGAGMGPDMGGMKETDSSSVFDGVRNPMCGMTGAKPMACYTENRATLHLHGGITPWISDGTPHQWTVPAGESTMYQKGVSVSYVPDMWYDSTGATIAQCAGQNTCAVAGATNDPGQGALTFYYTNQQSARLLFYHDHSWGITRLNVYAGEAAGYLVTDNTEKTLTAKGGPLDASDPALGLGIPLVIQDRTFVPSAGQLATQDPTWDAARWGGEGDFWYHHVYMPAQNPADPTGVSPYGRWMYGPWFWPPANQATTPYQPIPNPYYDPACDPATAPNGFCEPPMIPGTPNISVGMEQFNDTPIVNGTAYPTMTVEPKAYRFRLLNAANDRFFNLQWYVADSSGTEVALKASEVAAAQVDPNVFPTPDTTVSPAGPSWLQIGSEAGFLPTPVTVPNQPITWITDPTRFDFGNVDQHSMLIAPAERSDVIVDFSKYAGKTLILYNDAPAAFPARQASYDYYTGDPDNSDIGGAPTTVPGYGPNTRTIMQVKVASAASVPSAFSLSKLVSAFAHNASGTGVFESSQNPIIVGQAGYNRAYGTSFTSSGDCSVPGTTTKCDGFARINQQGGDLFTFDTLSGNKLAVPLQPKALHDEMNSSTFDEYGRMTANLGVEAVPANAGAQNVVLYPYVNPATEMIDATNLPVENSGIRVMPISTASDGTQIWKITHNGVDTHPIHFHLYDVQVINRVTWDNIILPPDMTELGWKDTVRVSPLEDTLVALRPILPNLPFQIPNSIRPLNPGMPIGSMMGFSSVGPDGNATTSNIVNDVVNFGWEYVWHCHILSHEEMDMMRPVSVAVPPSAPTNLLANSNGSAVVLNWTNTAANATGYSVQRATDSAFTANLQTWPVGDANSYTDSSVNAGSSYYYRVYATNTVGSTKDSGFTQSPGGNSMPTMTVASGYSNTAPVLAGNPVIGIAPAALNFGNVLLNTSAGPQSITLSNTGGVALTISSISLSANATQFAMPASATPCGATLDSGATCVINVTFSPTTLGAQSGTISIATNDPSSPLLTVPVTGSGIASTSLALTAPAIAYGQNGLVTLSMSSAQMNPVTGNVTLAVDGGAPLSQALVNGSATFTLTTLSAGTHTLAANYAAQGGVSAASATGSLVVNTAALTITASGASMSYGGPVPAITPGYSGFVLGQGPANLTGTVTCTTTATSTSPVSGNPYSSSCSGATSTNYAIQYVASTVTVNPATTATIITSNLPNPSIPGQIVTISFKVGPQFSGVPTGSVRVMASTGESCSMVLPAASCTLSFASSGARTLTATYSGDGNFAGSISPAANQQVVSGVVLSTTSLLFGNQLVGSTSASQAVTIANVGTTTLTINSILFGGLNAGDFTRTTTCGGTLRAGQNCRVNVSFRPTAAGTRTATLILNDSDVSSPQTVSLTGMGVQPVAALTPASYNFGTVLRRQTASYGFTLSNTGAVPLTINRISLTGANANQFTQRSNCGGTLGAGLSCTITVTFAPTQRATANATLSVSDNAVGSPHTASLSGLGQ
jgi:FtsP/CotA-like multicopper oxidase with cupredoxin domain